jgi:signal transduction histidine kinase/putative methionine-R-sulfoxide reductase with GAF domain
MFTDIDVSEYEAHRSMVKLVLRHSFESRPVFAYRGPWMARRLVPYGVGLLTVALLALLLGGVAYVLGIARIETYWLIYVLTLGALAWRFGRGPALVATGAVVVITDYYFLGIPRSFDVPTLSEVVREITGILGALAVIQFVSINRRRAVLTEKRKDLLQNVSPQILQSLDADAILNTVADATLPVIDYQHFRVYRWDQRSERLILVKSIARAEPYADIDWQDITFALGEGITGIAGQSRRSMLVPDASRDPRMIYPAGTQPLAESVLSVPMITRDRLYGVLTLARLGTRSLSVDDLRLMEAIAAQTALALANAEEYSEAEQTIKVLAMIESLKAGGGSKSDEEVDRRIIDGLADFGQAELATLRLVDDQGRFQLVATHGWDGLDHKQVPGAETLSPKDMSWLADERLGVYVSDPEGDDKMPAWAREAAAQAGLKSSIFLPLRAGQRLIGVAALAWRRPRWFRGEQLSRLQLLAAQAAITIDARQALEREHQRAEALAQLERARREFMQIASHELRTPLTVIRGYASMLEEGSLGQLPPAAQQALKTLLDKSTEMRVQVERMLLLARLEDGAIPPQMNQLDLRQVLKEAIDRVRPQVALKHGEMQVALADEPLSVIGDAERLGTAVDNLLQNAVKFTADAPRIQVKGLRNNGRISIVVQDNGIGIPEEARGRLFEKFYRVNDPTLHNVAGTGIGLYLVRQVVEGHGGEVKVNSRPGAGSCFEIDLPAARTAG